MGHLRRALSGNWRVAYRTPEGKERTKTSKTKREARAFLAQVEGGKTRGLYVDPAGAQLRFRDLADHWWAAREVELTTAAANRRAQPQAGRESLRWRAPAPWRRTADAGGTITREQLLGQVLPAVPRRYRAMVATAAGAGLRWGECVGLRRRSIDLLRRELQVVEVAVRSPAG